MPNDSFKEVTRQSWFSRIRESFKGIVIGAVFIVASVALLFWNEGRTVKRHKALEEGEGSVVSVSAERVDPQNEDRLVHLTGEAGTDDVLKDEEFGIEIQAIKLKRVVEMFQWHEKSEKKTKKNLGGSTTTETTYSYYKDWSERKIDSGDFKAREGHENPEMNYRTKEFLARRVNVGAFILPESLIEKIDAFEPYPVLDFQENIPDYLKEILQINGDGFYSGEEPGRPEVGDLRIRFLVVKPVVVSLISRQVKSTFEPYTAKSGSLIAFFRRILHAFKKDVRKIFSAARF